MLIRDALSTRYKLTICDKVYHPDRNYNESAKWQQTTALLSGVINGMVTLIREKEQAALEAAERKAREEKARKARQAARRMAESQASQGTS